MIIIIIVIIFDTDHYHAQLVEVTSITLNDAISFVFAFVLLSLSLLLVLSMSDQPIPEAAFEIQGTDVCERSLFDYLDGFSQGKKKTMLPFFSCTCYDFKVLFFFTNLSKALPTSRFTYMGHVPAARKRNHQYCVSLTPNNTWVKYIA